MTAIKNQGDQAFAYIKRVLTSNMDKKDQEFDKQDGRRIEMLKTHKRLIEKRLALQQKSKQMITTTSQYQVTSEPADPRQLPKIVRRALRNGEFVPHGKNCCISNNQHNDVMLDTKLMKEAFVMTAPPAYSAGQVFVKEKKAQFKKPVEVFNILKDQAGLDQEDISSQFQPQKRFSQKLALAEPDDFLKEPNRAGYLYGMMMQQFLPEEMDQLIYQERQEQLGKSLIESKNFSIPDQQYPQHMSYSGIKTFQDPTMSPNAHKYSPSNTIVTASLGLMIRAAKMAESQDADRILNVEQMTDFHSTNFLNKSATPTLSQLKRVRFAHDRVMLQRQTTDGENSDQGAQGWDEEALSEHDDFDDQGNKEQVQQSMNETSRAIQQFEQKHKLDQLD